MAKRIGPKMAKAARIVAENPGTAILPVAERVGPNGSRQYGYAIVHRAMRAGLVRHCALGARMLGLPRGTYCLVPS